MVGLRKDWLLFVLALLACLGLACAASCSSASSAPAGVGTDTAAWNAVDSPALDRAAADDDDDDDDDDDGGGSGGGAGCLECHPAPSEDPTMQWDDAPGEHSNCGECHVGEHGSKPVPPESVCLNCHQSDWSEKHAPTATLCLNCHLWPHVPLEIELKRGIHKEHKSEGLQCSACHKMMGGIMPSRAKCLACHTANETQHSRGALCSICHKS